MTPVTRVAVVVPVHDEERLLPRCLTALAVAADRSPVPLHLVLVLDACTDASAALASDVARCADVTILTVQRRNVGAARADGAAAALDLLGPAGTWLLNTDADSAVGPDWVRRHIAYARRGFAAVAGTVVVDDWKAMSATARAEYRRHYRHRWGHRHVHGANLGVAASAYTEVGGFGAVATHEDAALLAALEAGGHRIAWAADLPVRTSGRIHGRAPAGMSHLLRILDDGGRLSDAAPAPAVAPPP